MHDRYKRQRPQLRLIQLTAIIWRSKEHPALPSCERGGCVQTLLSWLVLLITCLAISVEAVALDTASITGTVTDPKGASIPNAHVSSSNQERGIRSVTVTNTAGEFLVPGLTP